VYLLHTIDLFTSKQIEIKNVTSETNSMKLYPGYRQVIGKEA